MSNNSKLAKEIPETSTDFTVQVEGTITKKQFIGEFTCKIPRRKEQCFIDKHRAALNGTTPELLEESTLVFHHMISYLRYTITESPKWWKESDLGYDLYDEHVVKAVYDAVLDFETTWLKKVWGDEAVEKLQSRGKDKNGEVKEPSEAERG
jgi:hypothetical protein